MVEKGGGSSHQKYLREVFRTAGPISVLWDLLSYNKLECPSQAEAVGWRLGVESGAALGEASWCQGFLSP